MRYTSLYGNDFVMKLDGSNDSAIDGAPYVREINYSFQSPFVSMPWKGATAEIAFAGEKLILDFA